MTSYSQADRLRERMDQAAVRHGEEIRADLPGIRVRSTPSRWPARRGDRGEVFFCTMGRIRVRKIAIAGDGRPLPSEAVVQGLSVDGEGTYDLINALVRSNGCLRIIVDEVTEVVRTPRITDRYPGIVPAPTALR